MSLAFLQVLFQTLTEQHGLYCDHFRTSRQNLSEHNIPHTEIALEQLLNQMDAVVWQSITVVQFVENVRHEPSRVHGPDIEFNKLTKLFC